MQRMKEVMSGQYSPKDLRDKWQAYWDEKQTFRTPNPGEAGFVASRPKNYILDFFSSRYGRIEDPSLRFSRRPELGARSEPAAVQPRRGVAG